MNTKIIIALAVSVLLHWAVVVYCYLPLQITPKIQQNTNRLSARIVSKALTPVLGNHDVQTIKPHVTKPQSVSTIQPEVLKIIEEQPVPDKSMLQEDSLAQAVIVSDYMAAPEVDRKALPQTTFDTSQLPLNEFSGLPIKLRLYINANGRLVRIERIGVLDQDDFFVSRLEQMLYKLSFLPARRDGVDVDSYQDIEFTLGLQPPLGGN